MPHVSDQKLDEKTMQELEERLMLVLSSPSTKTRQEIFRELLTDTEQVMLAKRLALIYLLIEDNASIRDIHDKIGISPSTVQRFERAVSNGGFQKTQQWLKRNKAAHAGLRAIAELVSRPYSSRSLHRFVDEEI